MRRAETEMLPENSLDRGGVHYSRAAASNFRASVKSFSVSPP
jgi:hypothetical protein